MKNIGFPVACACVLGLLAAAGAPPVAAQSVEDFYKSKRLTMIIAAGAGGGYDTYARVLARHYPNHIPGKPGIVAQNMPGASGITATNFLANQADRDGSVILATYNSLTIQPVFDKNQIRYDPRELNWIGSMGKLDNICVTWGTSPIKTLEQAKEREVISSATGATSNVVMVPNLLNNLVGTKFRPIIGYSTTEMRLAVERGEAEALCGLAYTTLMASNPDWILNKRVNVLVQITRNKIPQLGDAPIIYDFAKTEEQRQILDLWTIPQEMGRPFVAPPGVPKDRVTALRRAFDAAMKDKAFLAEGEKAHLDIDPITGEEMTKLIQEAYAVPPEVVKKTAEIVARATYGKKQ